MAELFLDEDTDKPFIRLDHNEMVRGLLMSAWHNVGSSLATLASGEARDTLTAIEDVASTYGTCRTEMWKLADHIKDCPDTITSAPTHKAAIDLCSYFDNLLKLDDINHNRPSDKDDPRVMHFIKATILFVDCLWQCLEQTKGRKARAVTKGFIQAVEEVSHGIAEPQAPTAQA